MFRGHAYCELVTTTDMPTQHNGRKATAQRPTRTNSVTSYTQPRLLTDGGQSVRETVRSFADLVERILRLDEIFAICVDEEFLLEGRLVLMTVYAWVDREPAIQQLNDEIRQVRIAGRVYELALHVDPDAPVFWGRVPVYAKGFAPDPDPERRLSNYESFPQTGTEGVELVRELVRDHHQNGNPNSLFRGDQFCLEDTLVEVTDSRPCRRDGELLGEFKLCPVATLSAHHDERPGEWVSARTLIHWRDENVLSNPSGDSARGQQ